MKCNICESVVSRRIFHKSETEIWTNSDDFRDHKNVKYPCELLQCNTCGHILQPFTKRLGEILDDVYKSEQHALSTLPGIGNWGTTMGQGMFVYLDKLNLKDVRSACEIGCGNDFYLKYLKETGVESLVGVEPSFRADHTKDGIHFKAGYADSQMKLNERFDLIYAMNVLEHVYDLNEIFQFVNSHISEKGNLFFCVPNCKAQLEAGDPALFIHEHINYFTEEILHELLVRKGFENIEILSTLDSYFVSAVYNNGSGKYKVMNIPQFDYTRNLDQNLTIIRSKCAGKKVAFHGVCNSLNNILGWVELDNDFILIDNDITKIGKTFFAKIVHQPDKDILNEIDLVFILPRAYSDAISHQYKELGYTGEIVKL